MSCLRQHTAGWVMTDEEEALHASEWEVRLGAAGHARTSANSVVQSQPPTLCLYFSGNYSREARGRNLLF